jgi:hypothetical protein
MSDSVSKFITVLEAFCLATGTPESTVSWRVFNDSGRIDDIRAGRDVGARKLDRAMQHFADHWPPEAVWPDQVERPLGTVRA